MTDPTPDPKWIVECFEPAGTGTWRLATASQLTGICDRCGRSIFGNEWHRA